MVDQANDDKPEKLTLSQTCALIVGGTAGIGFASARRLLDEGVPAMVIAGRNRERGETAAKALRDQSKAQIAYVQCDASRPDEVSALADACVEHMGGVDFLLSCGGGDPMPRLLKDVALDQLLPIINAVQAPILLPARAMLEGMAARGGGSIVCFASDAGKLATPGETAIGAAMASIIMFCRAMANEAKRDGVRVNCVTPSIVRSTPLYDKLMADPFCSRLFGKAEKLAALGVVEPDDLADLVCFLAGPQSARITGQTISVTGGISAI